MSMNKYMLRKIQLAVLALFVAVSMTACDSDDDGAASGPLAIHTVYQHTKKSTTRVIEKARLGTMIRLEGTGLATVREIYCNGYPATLNLNYVTPTSVIFRIPSKAPVGSECDPEVANTIRVVTLGGECTISFLIQDEAPSVSRLSHTLPNPGEIITIYGSRLREIQQVNLPGGVAVMDDGIVEEDEDGEFIRVRIPEDYADEVGGAIEVVSANGIAYSRNYFNRRKHIVNSKFYAEDSDGFQTSNNYCDDCQSGSHGYYGWGSNVATDLTETIPATGDGHKSTDNAKFGNRYGAIPGDSESGALPATVPVLSGSDNAYDTGALGRAIFNGCACYTRIIGLTKELGEEAITTATPLSKLAIQFDVYVPTKWSSGRIAYVAVDGGPDYMSSYHPWLVTTASGKEVVPVEMKGWETVTLPLESFPAFVGETVLYLQKAAASGEWTYQSFIAFYNDQVAGAPAPTELTNFCFYFQNLRIVPYEQPEAPDEDEEEEA